MSVIEQLGGYEKAKLHLISTDRRLGYTHIYLHSNGRYCFLDDYVDHIPDYAISIKSALKSLLEYRRANNIFEVGDKVVFKDARLSPSVKSIKEIINNTHAVWNKDGFHFDLIRHPTDAEIKAMARGAE